MTEAPVKCVVWDLDRTLWDAVLLETATTPTPRPELLDVLRSLDERGIMSSVASRNPATLAATAVAAVDWPTPLLAPQYGWGAKSASIRNIADELNIAVDSIAFVDDDPYERAEVASTLPDVMTLSPDEIAGALDWPRFRPATITAEARSRAEAYRDAQRRNEAARSFTGSRSQFQEWAGTAISIRPASHSDVPRLAEMSVRTNQFNSRATSIDEKGFTALVADPDVRTWCVALADRFGDDGIIGGVVIRQQPVWTVELIMMSCRAMGRGVIEAMLTRLDQAAHDANATEVSVPLRVNDRNTPLRLALVAAGYRADTSADTDEPMFRRPVSTHPPSLPPYVTVESGGQ